MSVAFAEMERPLEWSGRAAFDEAIRVGTEGAVLPSSWLAWLRLRGQAVEG